MSEIRSYGAAQERRRPPRASERSSDGWRADTTRPGPGRPDGSAGPSQDEAPEARLVALGVAEPTAQALLRRYGTDRVVDALDACDLLGDGQVRRRAVWVVAAIRQGWDLEDLLVERRQLRARYARWERERAERDREADRWRARESVTGAWRAAISAALDDRQLSSAIEQVTTPVAGLDRRSVPVVRAQLLAWAVEAHRAAPDVPLGEALADSLATETGPVAGDALAGGLPAPPLDTELADDLTSRLTHVLAERPDLARTGGPPQPTPRRRSSARAVSDGLTRGL
jgi:hypothetical protein